MEYGELLDNSRIAFGLITRYIDNPRPVLRFLENARQNGQHIDRIIIAYSHGLDQQTLEILQRKLRVDTIRAFGDPALRQVLRETGLSRSQIQALLDVPSWALYREVPYGAYRTAVLVAALLEKMDYLLFFDTDVQPRILTDHRHGTPIWHEIDFVGAHLDQLARPQVAATSSDYSGYYIIPPLQFEGLETLLTGLCKEVAYDYLCDCDEHNCLKLGSADRARPSPTNKALGGNLGLSLDVLQRLAPFFSTTYDFEGQCILGRGEDTLLGPTIKAQGGLMLDIDLPIFHDTYDHFPHAPDIAHGAIRDRFYRACLGWIGRNPFLTWFQCQRGLSDEDFDIEMEHQREALIEGGAAAAQHLDDDRFLLLPAAFARALETLPAMIDRHTALTLGWQALIEQHTSGATSDIAL